ncbi:MBL fold metallo-hydrolase [Tropicimonas sp. IMCC34011]|uniref:MBL fold metallo-hydrolase n=1 Tax=Tropicimonas sp. IMCC34011 TaxID=2248759 RepID=UPI001E36CB75|nr:MBL fold metallo-hydrolase [Tropicimonas sp. IMCC34011]
MNCDMWEPRLRRILAPNPSPMTAEGTNTFLVGRGDVAVIDPGPDLPAHLDAILAALDPGERIALILVTHSHLDHSGLAPALAARTGAPTAAFGDYRAGRTPRMDALAARMTRGSDGVDRTFVPDLALADGQTVTVGAETLTAIHTPGHISNHLCFAWTDALFTGDHVMGWSTSIVSPPEGDLAAFMASMRALSARSDRILYPAHGAPVPRPSARIAELIAHREAREAQILDTLAVGPATPDELAAKIYTGSPTVLLPMAARNVLSQLIDLEARDAVIADPDLLPDATFHLRTATD